MSKTMEGTVKWFNDAKGYGFLTPNEESGIIPSTSRFKIFAISE